MTAKKNVALFIETSSNFGRDLLSGIARYLKSDSSWSIFLEERDLASKPPKWFANWKGQGILTRAMNAEFAESARKSGIRVVDLSDRGAEFGFHKVNCDHQKIGELGAEHLLERGFRNLAFAGFNEEQWSQLREQGFQQRLAHLHTNVQLYHSDWYSHTASSWHTGLDRLCEWLKQLPKPVGIMACNDVRGQHLLNAASILGLNVPEELAVLGVDNDEVQCQLLNPALSSIKPNAERVGYRGAETLSLLMAGGEPPDEVQWIEPLGIAVRQSTDIVAIDDPEISAAIAYIRENACRGLKIQEILNLVPVSRSALERGFRKYLCRSPQQEIRNVQIKKAAQLLSETDLSMERIAHLCGFAHPEYMHVVFKRETGSTPGSYRRDAVPGR